MRKYWDAAFPPLQSPLKLVGWLIQAHTGHMFSYPVGDKNGGSSITALCFAVARARALEARPEAAGGDLRDSLRAGPAGGDPEALSLRRQRPDDDVPRAGHHLAGWAGAGDRPESGPPGLAPSPGGSADSCRAPRCSAWDCSGTRLPARTTSSATSRCGVRPLVLDREGPRRRARLRQDRPEHGLHPQAVEGRAGARSTSAFRRSIPNGTDATSSRGWSRSRRPGRCAASSTTSPWPDGTPGSQPGWPT